PSVPFPPLAKGGEGGFASSGRPEIPPSPFTKGGGMKTARLYSSSSPGPVAYAMMEARHTQGQRKGRRDRMDFVTVVDQAIALLRQRGRVTYRTLKRQFQLDDTALEDLTVELIKGQRLAADEDG